MTGPRVLALDLSLSATGVALPHGALGTIRPAGEGDGRLVTIRDHVRGQLDDYAPTLVALENYVVRTPAAAVLGMLHGVIRADLIDRGIPYVPVAPATLKTYAIGKGGGEGTGKPDMRMALYQRTGQDVGDDNQVDAAWLRLLALDLLDAPELALPKTHRRALDKLKLPAGVTP